MSWKKYFKTYDGMPERMPTSTGSTISDADTKRYSSWLPEVYQGQPNRVQRYGQYDQMDLDSEVNTALDTIAEFSTLKNQYTQLPLQVEFNEDPTDTESDVIQRSLRQWCKMNDLHKRMFRIFRNAIKYGDQIFVRDPETYKMFWVDPSKIEKVIVNEGKGKEIEAYYIKDLDINLQSLNVTADANKLMHTGAGYPNNPNVNNNTTQGYTGGGAGGTRYVSDQTSTPVDADHVVHISLSEGIDGFWPFGNSILEPVFKVYKQKELLEDAILIYRVQRAPERRVFYIDVGNMPTHKARAHLERIKNEIHQRRIPSKTGGGQNITDSAYNPLSIMEDYFFAQTAEGRGSKVETLPGGENLGQIDDLKYFNDKLMRGLRVPPSYLGSLDSDGNGYNDGRVGTAFIQEFRFTKFCERLQALVCEDLDREFKMFLKHRGVVIESSLFDLKFNTPQNFGKYRQAEVDQVMMNVFTAIEGAEYISKRFALKRFLGLTDEEVQENEKLWNEEKGQADPQDSDGLKSVGASIPGGDFEGGAEPEFDETDAEAEGGDSPISGAEGDLVADEDE
jgi:rRNA maturation protein Rpf1|tara:strand:- start:2748 stop:4436 length:1689 start_codon:yes stop_codon:yes gene_type:complete